MTILPENFQNIIMDMTEDFTQTFPEYSNTWYMWTKCNLESLTYETRDVELKKLYDYVLLVYPERFFDIIYQNEDIFSKETSPIVNTNFLPGIDFKQLFNCVDISEKTRKVMWNYLKLVLLSVVESVKDKTIFGKASTSFDDIDEAELLDKLTETMSSMTDFFKTLGEDEEKPLLDHESRGDVPISSEDTMPNVSGIFEHLRSLFDGKIGSLAKELAEEISGDFSSILGEDDIGDIKNTKDVINKLLKNPSKIKNLLKTVNDRLQSKLTSGEISQDELMKEVTDLMGKMKENGGDINFQDIFKNFSNLNGENQNIEEMLMKMKIGGLDLKSMMNKMGGMAGMAGMGGMGGMGKKTKTSSDNSDNTNSSKMTIQEKMKNRIMVKKIKQMEEELLLEKRKNDAVKSYVPYDFGDNTQSVFTVDEEGKQEKSPIPNKKLKNKKPKGKK